MEYEQCEGYEDPNRRDKNGNLVLWGMFGYPSAMLDMAIARDDLTGFRFYWDRYFAGGHEVLGGETIDQYAERKGAKKIASALRLKAAMAA